MSDVLFAAENEQATERLGRALARSLPDGTTVGLVGTLGAGKTRLVQAVAAACGVPREQVSSPTFVLCHEYQGQRRIYHLDVYRMADEDEFLALGPEEYFDSDGLTFVEWSDRVADCLPRERIDVEINIVDADRREFLVRAHGSPAEQVLAELQRVLNSP